MDMKYNFKMKKGKKGVSTIIVTVILIALVILITAIVWGVVRGIIDDKLSRTESCFGSFGEVSLNGYYTCYNNTGIYFSIEIADIEIESVIVSISAGGATKGFEISNTPETIANLMNYGGSDFGVDLVSLPGKNEGKTYITNFSTSQPDSIKIAPIINGQQCDASDSLTDIALCMG